jgi:hypothetical protein
MFSYQEVLEVVEPLLKNVSSPLFGSTGGVGGGGAGGNSCGPLGGIPGTAGTVNTGGGGGGGGGRTIGSRWRIRYSYSKSPRFSRTYQQVQVQTQLQHYPHQLVVVR